jgi:hypothetical protein
MPRGYSNRFYSQLSVVIPRSVHRMARRKAILCGAPSFAAFITAVLEDAPSTMTAAHLAHLHATEFLLKMHAGSCGARSTGESQKGIRHSNV